MNKAWIELRKKQGWHYQIEEIVDCGRAQFQGGQLLEGVPAFTYHIDAQEFDLKVKEDGTEYIAEPVDAEGNPIVDPKQKKKASGQKIMSNSYRIMVQRHSEPDIEVTGHYWEIVEFYKIGEQALLV